MRPRQLAFYAISAERLDGTVALVAEAIGGQARLVARRFAPLEPSGSGGRASRRTRRSGEPAVPDELGEAIIAGFARDRFLRMLDEPDPRFGGMTPRQAARNAASARASSADCEPSRTRAPEVGPTARRLPTSRCSAPSWAWPASLPPTPPDAEVADTSVTPDRLGRAPRSERPEKQR